MYLNISLVYCLFLKHFLSSLFNNLKEPLNSVKKDYQNVTTKMEDFYVDFTLKLSNYTSLKRCISKKIPFNFETNSVEQCTVITRKLWNRKTTRILNL